MDKFSRGLLFAVLDHFRENFVARLKFDHKINNYMFFIKTPKSQLTLEVLIYIYGYIQGKLKNKQYNYGIFIIPSNEK